MKWCENEEGEGRKGTEEKKREASRKRRRKRMMRKEYEVV